MKRGYGIAAGLAGVVVVFLLGPKVEVDERIAPVEIGGGVDAYLDSTEARFSDLRRDVEKTVIWHGEPGETTSISIVYVHGFSATRQELAPLCDSLASTLDANLFYTRLAGHGRTGEALGQAEARDWLTDITEAVEIGRRIGRQVVLVGNSTGATLIAWYLAAHPPGETADLVAAILISPNFGPRDRRTRILLWPWGGLIARVIQGERRTWVAHNPEQAKFWTTSYPTRALLPMMGLVDATVKQDYSEVDVPALFLYSPNDRVIDTARVKSIFGSFGASKKNIVAVDSEDPTGHILAGRIMSPSTTAHVRNLIESFLASAFVAPEWLLAELNRDPDDHVRPQ